MKVNIMHHSCLLFLGAVACAAPAFAAYHIVSIDAPGASNTQAFGLNNYDQVAVDGSVPYIYNAGSFVPVPLASTIFAANVFGINDSGVIVGSATPNSNLDLTELFIRSANGAYSFAAELNSLDTEARGVNNAGLTSGYYIDSNTGNFTGFLYTNTFTNFLTSPRTIAHGVNTAGQVVGNVNLDAGIACPTCGPGRYGFLRLTNGTFEYFLVNGMPTAGRGINDAEMVVGFTIDSNGNSQGFLVTLTGVPFESFTIPASQVLAYPGALSTNPEGINNLGVVVGSWTGVNGVNHGFQATPPAVLITNRQAMGGDLKVAQGSVLAAGFDFTMPGTHPAASVSFLNSSVTFVATCASGTAHSAMIVVPIPQQTYTVPANNPAWYPSGDQSNAATLQGSVMVPAMCDPGALVRLQTGGSFSTHVTSTDKTDKVNVRWHYGTNGGWSGTYGVIPN